MDFLEITSNNNWFKLHPEKIAGVEFETSSLFFPIQVKGTKDDVLRVTEITKDTRSFLDKKFDDLIQKVDFDDDVVKSLKNSYSQLTNDYDKIKIIGDLENRPKKQDNKKLALAKAKAKAITLKLKLL